MFTMYRFLRKLDRCPGAESEGVQAIVFTLNIYTPLTLLYTSLQ